MDTSKLTPHDPRVRYESAVVRGKTYKYILGEPKITLPVATVFLIHGFPDCSFGWRYQIPYLMSLGFRVVVPDMLGYAGSDAPEGLAQFSLKSMSTDIRELARKFVGDGQIILGGHDWGGALVWRIALWYPELLKGVFSVCTPFNAPMKPWLPLQDLIAMGKLKNFTYQLQLAGPEVEGAIQGETKVRQFLNGMWGGFGPNREFAFIAEKGVLLDNLSMLDRTILLSEEELNHYVEKYMLQAAPQLRGPLNWYRTRKINWEEELALADKEVKLDMPTMFIAATNDSALPPSMSAGMERFMPKLTRAEVGGSHWALTGASDEVNAHIGKWLKGLFEGDIKAAL
ncbi:alpha/beta hydrolase fold protein [Purpureocillium lavendulum]|uniref:Alpha/beta hydrolase fold protein n=1 Tax=Purpureocillium lavendulum TaxID=1247861 RepID=A0AB34G7D7_9HYPO|nr:alpha/beta hydrolase fold protein [Purpureocillium lavendulum]